MIAIFPELAQSAASGDAERLGLLARKYFGGPQAYAPRPDVEKLARDAGIRVERLPLEAHGALLAKDEKGRFTIVAVIPQATCEMTARFTLAHLLGHYFMDVQPLIARGDWQVSGYREVTCPLKRYAGQMEAVAQNAVMQQRELKADTFAASLLMPRGMVRKAMEKLGEVEKVAAFFSVTRGCLARRLSDLGMTAGGTPVSFLHAEQLSGGPGLDTPRATDLDQLHAPAGLAERPLPRAVAASGYAARKPRDKTNEAAGQSAVAGARSTGSHPGADAADQRSSRATPPGASGAASQDGERLSGMERLRAIARRLDKQPG